MRKNNSKSIPTSEVKSRVKMWRSGKNWVYGLLFFFGMTGVSIGQAHLVHADTKTLSTNTEKGTIASQLSDQKVTLQSSIKASATDRTNPVTSDREVSDSTAQPADTGENIAESQTDADASDTTQTADDTPTDSTSGSDQTAQTGETSESETTESSTNDPATLTTTETTLSTDATSTADSSKAATTVSNAPTQGHTTQTTNTTAQQSATTNTTVDSVASSTETVPSVNTPATTDGTTSQPKTTAGDTPSTVDTTNTPFPQVGYKSMLSAAQVQALNADNDVTGGRLKALTQRWWIVRRIRLILAVMRRYRMALRSLIRIIHKGLLPIVKIQAYIVSLKRQPRMVKLYCPLTEILPQKFTFRRYREAKFLTR